MNVFGKKKILNVFVGKKNDNVISEEKLKCGNKQLTMDSWLRVLIVFIFYFLNVWANTTHLSMCV